MHAQDIDAIALTAAAECVVSTADAAERHVSALQSKNHIWAVTTWAISASAPCRTPLESSRRGGHFEYRHVHAHAIHHAVGGAD